MAIGKFKYFKGISKVIKSTKDDEITYVAYNSTDNPTCEITFVNGGTIDDVEMFHIDKNGKKRRAEFTKKGKRNLINRNNSSCHINELIYQFDRIYRGETPVNGEYNHYHPVCWQDEEIIDLLGGEVTTKYTNQKHWFVLNYINTMTGRKYALHSDNVEYVDNILQSSEGLEDLKHNLDQLKSVGILY